MFRTGMVATIFQKHNQAMLEREEILEYLAVLSSLQLMTHCLFLIWLSMVQGFCVWEK